MGYIATKHVLYCRHCGNHTLHGQMNAPATGPRQASVYCAQFCLYCDNFRAYGHDFGKKRPPEFYKALWELMQET
jgi:hypothetical protein